MSVWKKKYYSVWEKQCMSVWKKRTVYDRSVYADAENPRRYPTRTRHQYDTHTTSMQHPYDNLMTTIRHPYDIHTTPIRHLHDIHMTPTLHPHGIHTTPTRNPHDTHTTSKRLPAETFLATKITLSETAKRTGNAKPVCEYIKVNSVWKKIVCEYAKEIVCESVKEIVCKRVKEIVCKRVKEIVCERVKGIVWERVKGIVCGYMKEVMCEYMKNSVTVTEKYSVWMSERNGRSVTEARTCRLRIHIPDTNTTPKRHPHDIQATASRDISSHENRPVWNIATQNNTIESDAIVGEISVHQELFPDTDKLDVWPGHTILTPSRPVPALTLLCPPPGRVATGVPILSHSMTRPAGRSAGNTRIEPSSAALEVDALTTRPRPWFIHGSVDRRLSICGCRQLLYL